MRNPAAARRTALGPLGVSITPAPQPWTHHGGALRAAQRLFPGAPAPWLDLSTGINPTPWPGGARIAMDWHRLPEAEEIAALEAAAAANFGVSPRHVCAVPGTEMAMRIIAERLGGAGQYGVPAYRTHGEMFAKAVAVPDLERASPALPLIFANPANPTGHLHARADLIRLLRLRAGKSWTLVDEAYADALGGGTSIADQVRDDRKLLIFRSFGKFYGLAGVRLGFLIGPRAFLAEFRAFLGAWPISSAAITLGRAAYADSVWARQMRICLSASALRLDHLLAAHGFHASGACPLFRLISCDDAMGLFRQLARHGILTRPFQDYPTWLRLGVPADAPAYARLARALADG